MLTPAPCDLANRSPVGTPPESPIRPPCWVRFLTGRPASATSYWAACVFKVFCPTPAAPCLFLFFLQPELGRCWSAVNLLVMRVVICQADSGKGLEQAASSRGVQGDAALLCCLPPGARSRTGDWQFSPTALRMPLSTVRRPERTAIALCFFCLLSDVPAASFMEMEGPRGSCLLRTCACKYFPWCPPC